MVLKLTEDAIQRILDGEKIIRPILQVLGFKAVRTESNLRYRFIMSDGQYMYNNCVMVDEDLISRIEMGDFEKYAVIQLNEYSLETIGGRKVLVMSDPEVLKPGEAVGEQMGNPVAAGSLNGTNGHTANCHATNGDSKNDSAEKSHETSMTSSADSMTIDEATIASLNIFPEEMDKRGFRRDAKTVYTLLNHCRTPLGQRLLTQWIRHPLLDLYTIEERLNLVEYFVSDGSIMNDVHERKLRKIPDLIRLSRRFSTKTASLTDMYQLYLMLKSLPSICESLGSSDETIMKVFVEPIKNYSTLFEKFEGLVEDTIDMDRIQSEREYRINPNFNDDLATAGQTLDDYEKKIKSIHRRIKDDLGLDDKEIKLHNDPKDGYFLSVTNKNEKIIRGRDELIIIQDRKKDGIRFTNQKLKDLNKDYMIEKDAYALKEKEVLSEIMDVVSGYGESTKELGELLAYLDVIVSLAVAANTTPNKRYIRPEILPKESGIISIKQLRHACLEQQDNYIPNDVNMDKSRHSFFVVTGPNMGGKSTYIRSLGVAVLMAQIGSFIPADSARISIVDGLYTRIGASDNQLTGNSTFMTEMVETATILKSANENSLIIIDELGRGTSTYDGFGIASAVSRHIALDIKAYCMFATHYHELIDLDKDIPTVGNLYVSAMTSEDDVTMLYEVKEGVCTKSYGINVARVANFPEDVIEYAEEKLAELEGMETKLALTWHLKMIQDRIREASIENMTDEQIITFVEELRNYKV